MIMCFCKCGFEVCGECILQDVNFVNGKYVSNVYEDFQRCYDVTPCYAGGRIEPADSDEIVISDIVAEEYAPIRREYLLLCHG